MSGLEPTTVPVLKDEDNERPIPSVWRPVFREIVSAFARGEFKVGAKVPGLKPISDDLAEKLRSCLNDYGVRLVDLPDETWETSVYIWSGRRWDTLVDLLTDKGYMDLVLDTKVTESGQGYQFEIHWIYVP